MKKQKMRTIAWILSIVMAFGVMPFAEIADVDFSFFVVKASAAEIVDSGVCGDKDSPSVRWTFDSDGVLTIIGEGKIRNYDYSINAPWADYGNNRLIYTLKIGEGITSIGDMAFSNCGIEKVSLPNSLLNIGIYSFYQNNFTEIVLPDSLESIGNEAFGFCADLEAIELPEKTKIIGSAAFADCYSLQKISIGSKIENISNTIVERTKYSNNPDNWNDGVLYIGQYLIRCDNEMIPEKYNIKDGTIGIAHSAFESCDTIKTVSIPASVRFIGNSAFTLCGNLKTVEVALVDSPIKLLGYPFHFCDPTVYFHSPFYAFELNSSFDELSQLSTVVDYHTFGEAKTVSQPDCENSGLTEKQCTFCGTVKQEKIPASGHSWNKGKVSTKATCVTDGVKTYTCTVCKATRQEAIPATGHAFGDWTELNADEHQRVCANDASHVETAAHTWNKGKVTTAATCETDGVKTYTCTVCKATRQETIPATGHAFGDWTKLNDDEHQRVCANDPSHVETAAHTWNKGKVTTAATCEADGVKTYTCTVCKATKTETIPATGHAFGEWSKLDENEHQRICANDPSHIETAAHNWDEGKVTKEPAPGVEGEKQFVCKDCGAIKSEPIEALPVETEAPTTEAPTTEAPTTEAPTTEAPTTEAPTTEAPTTEAPTTEAPTTEPGEAVYYTLGDVNMDGKINSADARLALRAAAKVETLSQLQELLADVDENGKLKAADARTILRISARLEPKPEKQIPVA